MNQLTLEQLTLAETLNKRIRARIEHACNLIHFPDNYWSVVAFEVLPSTHLRVEVTLEYDRDGDKEWLYLPVAILSMTDEELKAWSVAYLAEKEAEQHKKLEEAQKEQEKHELAQLKKLCEKYPFEIPQQGGV